MLKKFLQTWLFLVFVLSHLSEGQSAWWLYVNPDTHLLFGDEKITLKCDSSGLNRMDLSTEERDEYDRTVEVLKTLPNELEQAGQRRNGIKCLGGCSIVPGGAMEGHRRYDYGCCGMFGTT